MIASFVLVLVWPAAGPEPNISEPAGAVVCDGAAAEPDKKSAKGSASTWHDGGDMSVKHSRAYHSLEKYP